MSDETKAAAARVDLDAWRRAAEGNRFDGDPFFVRLLRRHLGERFARWEPRLRAVAASLGLAHDARVAEIGRDENLPSLRRHDADGRPIETVVFHPDYHEVGRVFWSSGMLAALAKPGNDVGSGALAYLLDQNGEAGHACPLACTAGAIKLLQKVGTDDQRRRHLPGLLESDYDRRLHAAQFVTEIQGGSDVGLNACGAVPEPGRPGWYRISGEKWFCSVADAGLFVVSARIDGVAQGTRGLGLFLVARTVNGAPNGFALRRLKSKLGTRSMATGEIEFAGALGEAIGPLEDGFRNLVGIVLDTSRVHNALASCGLMRRAFTEARAFACSRGAFDRRIVEFPAVQETLARMRLRTATGLLTTFRVLELTERCETSAPDGDLASARRIAVMINKYWTALAGTLTAREGIEILGGNGTIEDFSPLPRLYRDAMVIESWEGTHNTLCAQVLRDFAARALHRPWLRQVGEEIGALDHSGIAGHAARARDLLAEVSGRIDRLLASDPETAAAHVRHVVDRMCRLSDWVALLTQARFDLEHGAGSESLDLVELHRRAVLDPADPQENPDGIPLQLRVATSP
jgi:alkylation response protein AidB-like acyl-CoA dehydrogenase